MYVGVDDGSLVATRYGDENADSLTKHVPEAVLIKVPDEIGEIRRGIYMYKVVDGAFVLKDDSSDFVQQNKHAYINSYRSTRDVFLSKTDWTQTEDCPVDLHMKEKYKLYRKYLRAFPQTYDPELDENGEAVEDFNLISDFVLQLS